MADVKCPSCGKTNPSELEICQFCGTLLRQTRTEPLEPLSPGQIPERKATSELERTLPGWLRDARRAGSEPNTSPVPQVKVPQELPPPTPKRDKAPEAPLDLLAGLAQAGGDDEEIPDWLKSLQGETPAPSASKVEAQETPAWLEDLQKEPEKAEQPPQIEAWGFSSEAATFDFNESEEPAQSFGDTPDWLSSLTKQETALPQTQSPAEESHALPDAEFGEAPGWLASLGEFKTSSQQPQPDDAPSAPSGDLPEPDWLADLQSPTPATAKTPEVEHLASDLPDWMSGLQDSVPATAPAVEPLPPASDLPDWMSGLQDSVPAAEPLPVAESPLGDLPDWLASATGAEPAQETAPTPETPAQEPPQRQPKPFPTGSLDEIKSLAEGEPAPDFLSGLMMVEGEKKPEAEPSALPDWLTSMTAGVAAADSIETELTHPAESEKPVEAETATFTLPSLETELLFPESTPAETQNIDSLLLDDVPDWLSGFRPEVEQPAETAASEDALRPVELPSWVQAMRPVESMLTGTESVDDGDEEIEQNGPLAGFRSILPVVADGLAIRKPKTYALKLQVDETQRKQAALLEQLLSSENKSKAVPAPQETTALLRPLRWALFAILVLAALIPSIFGTRAFPAPALPNNANSPFSKFYDTLANTVPDSAPVLVVTDYQPGFAGEMEQAAAPVVTHLMRKNAQMAFISTSPVSAEMGERLLRKGRAFYKKNGQDAPSYQPGKQYLFLGYLPGGAAGVKAFAEQPQRMTGVDSLNGDLWQTDMLRDKVADISGFAAVIVITDDPDNGRLWIEQTGARLGNTPMLMITSAQAGPMLQPYAVSGQLSGLVVGLEGGAFYEKRDAQPGDSYPGHIKALYWDGFGAVLIVALLAIFIGALWSLVERFRAGKEVTGQDEA